MVRPVISGDYDIDRSHALPRSEASLKLEAWRDYFTVGDAVERCTNNNSKFTVVVLGSGGCVDTISAIRAGWSPIWGTEVCPELNWAPVQPIVTSSNALSIVTQTNNKKYELSSLRQNASAILSVIQANTPSSNDWLHWNDLGPGLARVSSTRQWHGTSWVMTLPSRF